MICSAQNTEQCRIAISHSDQDRFFERVPDGAIFSWQTNSHPVSDSLLDQRLVFSEDLDVHRFWKGGIWAICHAPSRVGRIRLIIKQRHRPTCYLAYPSHRSRVYVLQVVLSSCIMSLQALLVSPGFRCALYAGNAVNTLPIN